MFKAVRILQVSVVSLLLAGCATSQTTLNSTAASGTAPAQKPSNVGARSLSGNVDLRPPQAAQPIEAGRSFVSDAGFLKADGSLTANIQAYARDVAQARSVPLSHVESLLRQAQYDATVVRLMTPSKNRIRRSWVTYRNRFIEPIRIKAGEQFWNEHRTTLDEVARDYGVPPSIIVAIIGIETVYGRNTGDFPVLNALTTLAFRYPDDSRPERGQLFRDQLADLIQLDYEGKLDARLVRGSFAGAMGLPQFMPGSLMRFAADGDEDGRIDLLYSVEDAITSVARFLRLHGWTPGLPVFAPVELPPDAGKLVSGGLEPVYTWKELESQGARDQSAPLNASSRVSTNAAIGDTGTAAWKNYKLGVVDLLDEPRGLAEYRTGTPNFFAITHYNRSYFYATSVADLAQILAQRLGYGSPN